MNTNRRSFLKASGLAVALGSVGLAGCNQFIGGDGSTDAGTWQYDPRALASSPNVGFMSMDYGRLYENRDELPESMAEDFETESADSPIGPADIDHVVGVGGGSADLSAESAAGGPLSMFGSFAITGDIPRDELASELESDQTASEVGEYEGYTMYESADFEDLGEMDAPGIGGSGAVALGDSAVVAGVVVEQNADVDVTGRRATEQMIDAQAGSARRISETSGPSQRLQNTLGETMVTVGLEVDPELVTLAQQAATGTQQSGDYDLGQYTNGFRAGGFGMDIGGDVSEFTFVAIYESAERADEAAIDDTVEALAPNVEGQDGIESLSGSRDGEAITVTMTGDTQRLFEASQSASPGPEQTQNLAAQPF